MRRFEGNDLCAPSDLIRFLGCAHATYLDLVDLETPLAAPKPQVILVTLSRENAGRA